MKKQAILATVSLALVALASCGGSSSASDSASVSVPEPEPSLKQQWDAIENWQGGVDRNAFFLKTATIGTESAKATSRKAHSEDISGDLGERFGMENDWGYVNQDYKQDCTLYSNDKRVCSIVEVTDTTNSSNAIVTTTLNQTSNAYIEEVDSVDTFFNVVDDGSEIKLTPNNYYSSRAVGTGETFQEIAGFEMSTTGGVGQRLTLAYYNALDDAGKAEVKYYTNSTDTGVEYIYWAYMDFTAEGYVGHTMSIKISAKFNGNVLLSVDCDQGYYVSEVSVYLSNIYYEYGYEAAGEYSGAVLDYKNYKVVGTLDLHMTAGDLNFTDYFGLLVGSYTAQTGAPAFAKATTRSIQNFGYNKVSYQREYRYIEDITSTYYSDGYVVSDYSLQEVNTTTGNVEEATMTTQLSHDASNVYEIVSDYENNSYKETTAIDATHTWEGMSNISESEAIRSMYGFNGLATTYETGVAAYDNGDGVVELYLQQVRQQGANNYGVIIEVAIVIQIEYDTDGETPVGISVLQSGIFIDNVYTGVLGNANYFYDSLIYSQSVYSYGYNAAITTSAANYTPLDPNNYVEKPAEETQALVSF